MPTLAPNTTPTQIGLGQLPEECGRSIPLSLDFATNPSIDLDLTYLQSQGQFSNIQSLYINNSLNGSAIFITVPGSQQTLTIKANTLAYLPVIVSVGSPKMTFASAGGVVVPIQVMNFFVSPIVWTP